ncbi:hypothetical protein UPYG_G00332960 [Umbra pygmaea]|uniref:BPTI/Kunitz inhibitor domain-containing protein n=1 Tax=Umbra pygmaea TaxID=75934 RepID=A0ABD0VW80_UMBPY
MAAFHVREVRRFQGLSVQYTTMDFGVLIYLIISCSFCYVLALSPKQVACLLEIDEGPCRGEIERYYYNTINQKCEKFYYGGCRGNANNFMSFEACHKACFKIPKIPQICRFQKNIGPCRGSFLKYFFNMTTMQCEPFFYGGCNGNENRFDDHTSCLEYCKPQTTLPVLCLETLDKGGCAASIQRYYYNAASRTCEQFIYTGCGGSSNNFVSKQSCMDVCAKAGNSVNTGNRNPTNIRVGKMKIRKKKRIILKPINKDYS